MIVSINQKEIDSHATITEMRSKLPCPSLWKAASNRCTCVNNAIDIEWSLITAKEMLSDDSILTQEFSMITYRIELLNVIYCRTTNNYQQQDKEIMRDVNNKITFFPIVGAVLTTLTLILTWEYSQYFWY